MDLEGILRGPSWFSGREMVGVKRNIEEIYSEVLNGCYEVHKYLGPGLLESAYSKCLIYELQSRGLKVEFEKPIPIIYKEVHVDCGFRLDMIIEDVIILELKSSEKISDLYLAQILTYMKLTNIELGLLVNFNNKLLKNGIKRVVL